MAKPANKKLSDDRNRLLKLKAQHEGTVNLLEKKILELKSEISDLESLKNEKSEISGNIGVLKTTQTDLETSINESKSKNNELTSAINTLDSTKKEIDNYIAANSPTREELKTEISTLNKDKQELLSSEKDLKIKLTELENDIKNQTTEKSRFEGIIKNLREKHGLYSKDMKDIALDSKKQLVVYAVTAIFSLLGALSLMIILLCVLTNKNSSFELISSLFPNDANFQFYSLLIVRVTISAAFVFFFIVFINLTRGFIAQYIKTKNKMTAIRIADFLIGRIHTKGLDKMPEQAKQALESEKIKEQVELLNTHIPKIMDLGSSSFERTSKTKDPTDAIKEIISLIKVVKP